MKDIKADLLNKLEKIEENKKTVSELAGRRKEVLETLKRDFDIHNKKGIKKELNRINKKGSSLAKQMKLLLDKLETDYEWN